MKVSVYGLVAVAVSAALATAAFGADPAPATPPPEAPGARPAAAAPVAPPAPAAAPAAQAPAPATAAAQAPAANGGSGAPLTREQIVEQGAKALKDTCEGVCHLSDKWESASRDRAGWAESVDGMIVRMRESELPLPSARTYNLIVDYLAITRPQ